MKEEMRIEVTLRGIRPILFDRYPGDNDTKLEPMDKMYVNAKGECILPILNVFSLLTAKNTQSVPNRFYGKKSGEYSMAVGAFCAIEAVGGDEPTEAVICDEDGKPYKADDPRIKVIKHVARLSKGVPNPKARPMIPKGWQVRLMFTLQDNTMLSPSQLKTMVDQGGLLGLGTFKPIFGRYVAEWAA